MRILYFLQILTIFEVQASKFTQLNPKQFDKNEIWLIDFTNLNDNHCFRSIFWFNCIAFCVRLTFIYQEFSSSMPHFLQIHLYHVEEYLIVRSGGPVSGNLIHQDGRKNNTCLDEEFTTVLYTDYLNVIVLQGGDENFGHHLMILRSKSSNMTFNDSLTLVKENTKLKLESLVRVVPISCNENRLNDIRDTYSTKCTNCTKTKNVEGLNNYLWIIIFPTAGLLWAAIVMACWIIERKNRNVVVPFNH